MRHLWRRVAALTGMLALSVSLTHAQSRNGTISGRVVDAAGTAPIANVTIAVAGTTIRAVTGEDGRYTLRDVPAGTARVRALRLGFSEFSEQVSLAAGQTLVLNITLTKVAIDLTAVIATATGDQRRLEVPNQIAQINAEKVIENSQVSNVGDLLIGKAAGVQILPGSGVNAASRIRIRGTSSVSLNNDPIVIVDGVRINSSASGFGNGGAPTSRLNDINPEDIETIDVIRGPAASATYGTDAATGVIVITTKRGRAGAARWSVYTEQGITRDENEYPDAYTAWGRLQNQTNPANNGRAADCNIVTVANNSCAIDSITTFNLWRDPRASPLRTGSRQQYGVSVSGGSDAVSYFVGVENESTIGVFGLPQFERDRFNRQGIAIRPEWEDPNTFRRFGLRTNLDLKISPQLQIPIRTFFLTSQQRAPEDGNNTVGLGSSAFGGPGTRNRLSGTDSLYGYRIFTPGDIFQESNEIDLQRWLGSITPVWTPTNWLTARANLGLDYTTESYVGACLLNECTNFGQRRLGFKDTERSRTFQWTGEWSATGSFRPTDWLSTRTTAGFQFVHREDDSFTANVAQLPPGGGTLSQGAVPAVAEGNTVTKTAGVFVEQNFQMFDKVDVVASVRGDQNSAFGENFGVAYYPRAGVSYRISEEGWFPFRDQVNLFRFRSSWGQSGIRPGTTAALQFFSSNVYRDNNSDVPGLIYQTLGNANLRPETVTEVEGGFDMGLFNDRITTTVTYYNKKSSDAIVNQTLPPSLGTGSTARAANIGSVRNWGWEYLVTAQPLRFERFAWDFTVNGSYNSNEVLNLGGIPAGTGAFRNAVGFPINSIWDRPFTFRDVNENGIIELPEVTVDSVQRFMGYSTPRAELSIQNGFDLLSGGQLRVTVLVDGKLGGLVQNTTERFRCATRLNSQERVDPSAALERQARCIAFLKPGTQSTNFGYFESGNYWRVREFAVTWRVPERLATAIPQVRNSTITVAGRNLALFSDFTGVDPETTSGVGNVQAEFQTTPPLQTWTVRFNFGF